ncbi:MAG: hypothetical protein KQ78_00933 [Candidatus Izimaplasma bacterium HR2]|nr:MAG: hypothetical protein KQ78_00933 [Candidatus Izimaplasma bacterium HR2]
MKWTIHELIKKHTTNNKFEAVLDFSNEIVNTDILAISEVNVKGDYEVFDSSEFVFNIDIKCTLALECAITLKEVPFVIDIQVEEVFSIEEDEDSNTIEGITIDLLPIIWSNIILEMPMRVISENAYDNFELDNTEFDDDEVENAFSNLKNYKK